MPQKCYAEAGLGPKFFFVGLPDKQERRGIFEVHLSHLRPHTLKHFDLSRLAYETPDFSGAEIEQAIIEAMYLGFSQGRDFTTDDVLEAASQIVPLARNRARNRLGRAAGLGCLR